MCDFTYQSKPELAQRSSFQPHHSHNLQCADLQCIFCYPFKQKWCCLTFSVNYFGSQVESLKWNIVCMQYVKCKVIWSQYFSCGVIIVFQRLCFLSLRLCFRCCICQAVSMYLFTCVLFFIIYLLFIYLFIYYLFIYSYLLFTSLFIYLLIYVFIYLPVNQFS